MANRILRMVGKLAMRAMQNPQVRRKVQDAVMRGVQQVQNKQYGDSPTNRSRSSQGKATLKASGAAPTQQRGYERTDNSSASEGSPGQFGPGATRDVRGQQLRSLDTAYAPHPDGDPDPGEVIWTWVPFVEQDGRGKDRPVLIIGRFDDGSVAGCYLSTKQHDGFISVGSGAWDSKGRQSFLNPDRVLRVTENGMRREASVMPREQYERVIGQIAL